MSRFTIFNVCIWLYLLGREVLRCLLALSGNLEWRGWYIDWHMSLIPAWPSYVTMWSVLTIPIAVYYVWTSWNALEWKDDDER